MSYPESKQALESQYFNWKCVICSQVAISSFTLEEQHLIEYGPYTDINGDKWIKCDNCFHPYHIHCLKEVLLIFTIFSFGLKFIWLLLVMLKGVEGKKGKGTPWQRPW